MLVPSTSTLSIRFGFDPLVLKVFSMSPINKHEEEFSMSEIFVSLVLSIKKDGKKRIKSLILFIPIE
jgi:hypothetical protein